MVALANLAPTMYETFFFFYSFSLSSVNIAASATIIGFVSSCSFMNFSIIGRIVFPSNVQPGITSYDKGNPE